MQSGPVLLYVNCDPRSVIISILRKSETASSMDDEGMDGFVRASKATESYPNPSRRREKPVSEKGKRDNAIQGTMSNEFDTN